MRRPIASRPLLLLALAPMAACSGGGLTIDSGAPPADASRTVMIQDAALPIDRSIGAIDLPMSVSDLAIGPQKDLSIASMDQSVTVDLKPLLDAASVTDFATANCSTAGCPANQVCVKEHDSGGACLPPAADGSCPADHLLENGCCVYDVTTYNCRPLPNSCNGVPSCACAASLCLCTCQGASASEVDCACFYP